MRRAGLVSGIVTAILLIAWFLLLRPDFLGGPVSYVIVAGSSMEPTLQGGDLVIVKRQSAYENGDIVAFRAEGGIVIHRIIGGNADGYVMKGDNKALTDAWEPNRGNIVGEKWLHVPSAGHLMSALKTPVALSAVIGVLATMSVLGGAEVRRRRRRRSAALRAAYAEILDHKGLMRGKPERIEAHPIEPRATAPRGRARMRRHIWPRLRIVLLGGLYIGAIAAFAGAVYGFTGPSTLALIPLAIGALATLTLAGASEVRRRQRRRNAAVRAAVAEISDYKDLVRERPEGFHSHPVEPAASGSPETARPRPRIWRRLQAFVLGGLALSAVLALVGAIYAFLGSSLIALIPALAAGVVFLAIRLSQIWRRRPNAERRRPEEGGRLGLGRLPYDRWRGRRNAPSQTIARPLTSIERHSETASSLQPPPWILGSLAAVAIITAAAAALAVAAFLKPEAKPRFVERVRYEHAIRLDPSVIVAPSALYPEGSVKPEQGPSDEAGPTIVYTRLIRNLQLDLAYSLRADHPSNVSGEIGADVEIGFKDGWQKRLEPAPAVMFNGASGSTRLIIDVPAILTLLDSIEKEIDFKAPVYELVVSPVVRASGSVSQETIDDTFTTSYVIKFNRTQLVIGPDLAHAETKTVGDTLSQSQEIGLFGESIPVQSARLVAVVGLPIGLVLLALLGSVAFLGLGRGKAAKIQSRYGSTIVSVTALDPGFEDTRVRVAAFQDLIRIADRTQTVILHQSLDGNRHRYLVKSDLVTYEFELAQGKLSESNQPLRSAA